jgi:hypothetical protein
MGRGTLEQLPDDAIEAVSVALAPVDLCRLASCNRGLTVRLRASQRNCARQLPVDQQKTVYLNVIWRRKLEDDFGGKVNRMKRCARATRPVMVCQSRMLSQAFCCHAFKEPKEMMAYGLYKESVLRMREETAVSRVPVFVHPVCSSFRLRAMNTGETAANSTYGWYKSSERGSYLVLYSFKGRKPQNRWLFFSSFSFTFGFLRSADVWSVP